MKKYFIHSYDGFHASVFSFHAADDDAARDLFKEYTRALSRHDKKRYLDIAGYLYLYTAADWEMMQGDSDAWRNIQPLADIHELCCLLDSFPISIF